MTDPYFVHHLENLQKLHSDLEKQMKNFDEVIPYELQTAAHIYSPRLLNMMLVCGAQIEAITRLISKKCRFPKKNIRSSIRKIDEKGVLSKFQIFSIPHQMYFKPFEANLEWWEAYNELKHDLDDKQFKITYTTVMNAFAALSGLQCLANKLVSHENDETKFILDTKNWSAKDSQIPFLQKRTSDSSYPFWRSMLFEVRSFYFHFGYIEQHLDNLRID